MSTDGSALCTSIARATNRAPLPSANAHGVAGRSIDPSGEVGDRVPIHASSAGRALLAQMSAEERANLYRKIDFTDYSITTPMTPERIEADLTQAAARGYHQSYAEYTPDLAGVAMPLTLPARRLSIVVVGPTSRCLAQRPALAAILARHVDALKA